MTSTDNSLAHVLKRKSKLPKLNISLVILCHNVWDVFGCCERQMVCFVRFFLLLPNAGIVSLSCTFLVWMEDLFEFLHNSYTLSWLSLTHFLPLSNLSTILELTPETHSTSEHVSVNLNIRIQRVCQYFVHVNILSPLRGCGFNFFTKHINLSNVMGRVQILKGGHLYFMPSLQSVRCPCVTSVDGLALCLTRPQPRHRRP